MSGIKYVLNLILHIARHSVTFISICTTKIVNVKLEKLAKLSFNGSIKHIFLFCVFFLCRIQKGSLFFGCHWVFKSDLYNITVLNCLFLY